MEGEGKGGLKRGKGGPRAEMGSDNGGGEKDSMVSVEEKGLGYRGYHRNGKVSPQRERE